MATASIPVVRLRVHFNQRLFVGIGKVELLEHITRTGSLSQAAREMNMSYRRAWLLLEAMNEGFDQPVATTSAGGRRGGGTVVTEFGRHLVAGYRRMESKVQFLAAAQLREVTRHVKGGRPKEPTHPSR
jgi:molybdate transport system regulatory protein